MSSPKLYSNPYKLQVLIVYFLRLHVGTGVSVLSSDHPDKRYSFFFFSLSHSKSMDQPGKLPILLVVS